MAILKINAIRVETNITEGAYCNGIKTRTVHTFFPSSGPGFKILETPSTPIYQPVTVKEIPFIRVRIVDQTGEHLVNFRGEIITVRLHIKEYGSGLW